MTLIRDIPVLKDSNKHDESLQGAAYKNEILSDPGKSGLNICLETYGCQMNFSDSEIVASVLSGMGCRFTNRPDEADVYFINTCSIREHAEQTVFNRIRHIRGLKKRRPDLIIGVLGCMAERLKHKLLEQERLVDIVAGPDSYRHLPSLLQGAEQGQKGVNVFLSLEETYADISPVRLDSNGVTAFVTIMRGCNNMCSFCVVPFTRGRERSRNPETIEKECSDLFSGGYREVTLLGQNVDSYYYDANPPVNFAKLLERIACILPDLRIRFSTSHPKDISDELLATMAEHENICKFIHLPVQSGSNRILELMHRGYTKGKYLERIRTARQIIPRLALSTDIISGFPTENETDHLATISLMEEIGYEHAFMFKYSERPGTPAARLLKDDVPDHVKTQRLNEIISLQNKISGEKNMPDTGRSFRVLIEGDSRRSPDYFCGRNDSNKMVVFPKRDGFRKGDYADVLIRRSTSATLLGEIKG